VTYPFLVSSTIRATSVGELTDKLSSKARRRRLRRDQHLLDGTGGLKPLFTPGRAARLRDKMAIAGSINVLSFTNVAESIVHAGAMINQDPFYRPIRLLPPGGRPGLRPGLRPGSHGRPRKRHITHSANANNVDEHVVSIEATNYMQFMNVTGVFGFHLRAPN